MNKEELVKLALEAQSRIGTAELAARQLRSAGPQDVPHARTSTSELLRIETRRLRSQPDDIVGLDALVGALRTTSCASVDLYAFSHNGVSTSLVVTESGELIGCVIGPDRRRIEQVKEAR
ncbi:hypothetical protein CELD12_15840 [Cellulomonas sp. NTE-D12]|nr:hypothetical protein CELD12_15840 [Cellulomonas sp. NTE-D12]